MLVSAGQTETWTETRWWKTPSSIPIHQPFQRRRALQWPVHAQSCHRRWIASCAHLLRAALAVQQPLSPHTNSDTAIIRVRFFGPPGPCVAARHALEPPARLPARTGKIPRVDPHGRQRAWPLGCRPRGTHVDQLPVTKGDGPWITDLVDAFLLLLVRVQNLQEGLVDSQVGGEPVLEPLVMSDQHQRGQPSSPYLDLVHVLNSV